MRDHLIGERDLGLRPLPGAQRDVARRDLGVGALARGHGSDDVDLFVSRAIMGCATQCAVGADLLAGRTTDPLSRRGAATRH